MAHYAKLGLDNIVLAVVMVDNIDCMTRGGIEKEEIGLEHLIQHHSHESWKQCSYNTRLGVRWDPSTNQSTDQPGFRGNYPGIGWYYNSEHDIFHPPIPIDSNGNQCNSYVLDPVTGMWNPPLDLPEGTKFHSFIARTIVTEDLESLTYYEWNELLYQSDNTKGWELKTREI